MRTVRRAYFMASLEQHSQIVVSLAMISVISRLLSPAEIGLSVIGLAVAGIVFTAREFVTSDVLIPPGVIDIRDIQTASTLVVGCAVLISIGLFAFAPLLANFYGEPLMIHFLRVMALSGIFDAFTCPTSAILRRDMDFGTLTRVSVLTSLVNAGSVLLLAAFGMGAMSFALGALAACVARMALLFHAVPNLRMYIPRLTGSRAVFSFGIYKGASSLLDKAYDALPQLVLGRILPLSSVGLYNRANLACSLPDKILLSAVYSVAFPAFAAEVRAQNDIAKPYLRMISYITALYWPATLMLAILADPIVRLVLGNNWLMAVPIVQILACASVFYFPNILTYPILMALGANRAAFASNVIGRGLSTLIICGASFYGLIVLALSQFIAMPLQMIVSLTYVRRHAPFGWKAFFAVLTQSGIVTAFAIAGPLVVVGMNKFSGALSFPQTGLCAVLSAIGWGFALILTRHPLLAEFSRLTGRTLPPWLSWSGRQQTQEG